MKLVIGLGNIGPEYEQSRHNAGFLCLRQWSNDHRLRFKKSKLFAYAQIPGACLIMPATYMNRSGLALAEALRRWSADDVMVVQDDIELPLGQLRLRNGGGDGGHNGVRSLLSVLPPDKLKRLRIGIGRGDGDPRNYVLDTFNEAELAALQPVLDQAASFVDTFIQDGFTAVLNAYSIWKKSCSGDSSPGNISPKEKPHDQEL